MSDIKIIKPGKTGFGVLIEQDAGYISPNDERNKAFIVEAKKLGEGQPVVGAPYIVYVVLQKHSVKNRNGRIYPKHILERENNNYQELIQQRRAIGELDHPESSIIAGDRISHNIIETWWEGKTLMGKMEILMSPGYMNYGIVSTKGDEVEIICWDVVTSPSTPGSWMFDQPQQAKQYTESKEITKNLMVDNINKFLLD